MANGHRRVFAMVRAVQKGLVPENEVSSNIRFLARNLSTNQIYELMRNPDTMGDYLGEFVPSFKADHREKKIRKLAEEGGSLDIGGSSIDKFSAYMLSQVLDKLTPKQKRYILNRSMDEAVAIAYKLASRSLE